MRKVNPLPSQEFLRLTFDYSFIEGALYWKDKSMKYSNTPAGSIIKGRGYHRICINRRAYARHRLVWAYFHSDPLDTLIDHINGVRNDDRIENLRLATESDNRRNSKMYITNTSGYKGVTREKTTNKWKAYIYIDNKRKHLGMFNTKDEAARAYSIAAAEFHGDFAGASQ